MTLLIPLKRLRGNIKRSRGTAKRDKLFSEEIHKDLISFCKSTRLKRKEITSLKGNQLIFKNNNYYIGVIGKGGRYRELLVIDNVDLVVKLMNEAGNNKVFKSISTNANIHSYRADYEVECFKIIIQTPFDSSISLNLIKQDIVNSFIDVMKDFNINNWYKYSVIKDYSINEIINIFDESDGNFIFKDSFTTNNKTNLWELEIYTKNDITFN